MESSRTSDQAGQQKTKTKQENLDKPTFIGSTLFAHESNEQEYLLQNYS